MAKSSPDAKTAESELPRSWPFSVGLSVGVIAVGVVLSATINPLFDRAVHWDWMAVLVPVLLVVLTLALRRRWV